MMPQNHIFSKLKLMLHHALVQTPILIVAVIVSAMLAYNRADAETAPNQRAAEKTRVENFALLDHLGRFHELYYYSDAKAIVLFVQGNGCQIVRNTLPALKQIRSAFEASNVVFLMINPNPQDDRKSIAHEAQEFDIDFPILVDETQFISESLAIQRTAEVFVIDPSRWEIIYRGPVDNRLGYETQKPTASRSYLTEVLGALLDGVAIDTNSAPVLGCAVTLLNRDPEKHQRISYADNIVPILERRCVSCHREDGIAPWAMTSYATIRGWSSMIREVVRTKRMPPWHADPHVGRFSNEISLSLEEAKLLVHWIEAGAPRGKGPDALEENPSTSAAEWPLGEPSLVLTVEPQQIPATGIIDYRFIRVPVPLEQDVWVRAVVLRPSNPKVLHHGFTYVLEPKEDQRKEVQKSRGKTSALAVYVPGTEAQVFPEGTGRFLPAGSEIQFQLHYTSTGRAETDTPRLALYFSNERPNHELKVDWALNRKIHIPPGVKEYKASAFHEFEKDVLLYNIFPHMHYRGKWMNVAAQYPDGTTELLVAVPNYQFNWQRFYIFEQPKYLPAGTKIRCDAAYDNSAQNLANPDPSRWVTWGRQSYDEMCVGYMDYRELDSDEFPQPKKAIKSTSQ